MQWANAVAENAMNFATIALEGRSTVTKMAIKIRADNILWEAKQSSASKRWIAVCDSLNLVLEADSTDELHSLIGEAMHLLLLDLLEDNELDAFLRERGWQSVPDSVQQADGVEFDVPWQLLVAGNTRDSKYEAH